MDQDKQENIGLAPLGKNEQVKNETTKDRMTGGLPHGPVKKGLRR
ncbi:hypothetical protein FTV88_0869 [Heliorestis convoluta]|uniref:Uncharacterized protein n=1 Tax=Heliorestis convoluta TaxID=356322 RepID=A0A5Q2N376_9FIRM|nr:hypothetical protein FTV88_0869 [Heliorestis convoluta]